MTLSSFKKARFKNVTLTQQIFKSLEYNKRLTFQYVTLTQQIFRRQKLFLVVTKAT